MRRSFGVCSFGWNEGHARRSELDRERKTIYPTTNLRARALSALGVERGADPHSSALAKQLRRRLGFERRESEGSLALDPERLAARREDAKSRQARRQCID